jgi:hypothetical protein
LPSVRGRREFDGADAVVDSRLQKDNQAKRQLQKLESMDASSEEFIEPLKNTQQDVLKQANSEENEEFNKLAA